MAPSCPSLSLLPLRASSGESWLRGPMFRAAATRSALSSLSSPESPSASGGGTKISHTYFHLRRSGYSQTVSNIPTHPLHSLGVFPGGGRHAHSSSSSSSFPPCRPCQWVAISWWLQAQTQGHATSRGSGSRVWGRLTGVDEGGEDGTSSLLGCVHQDLQRTLGAQHSKQICTRAHTHAHAHTHTDILISQISPWGKPLSLP